MTGEEIIELCDEVEILPEDTRIIAVRLSVEACHKLQTALAESDRVDGHRVVLSDLQFEGSRYSARLMMVDAEKTSAREGFKVDLVGFRRALDSIQGGKDADRTQTKKG